VKVLDALHELWDEDPSKSTGYPATAAAIVYTISPTPSRREHPPNKKMRCDFVIHGKAARQ